MAEQHVKFMESLGIPKEQIDAVEALTPEQLKEWKPDPLTDMVRTGLKSTLSNDPDFLASIPADKLNPEILKGIEKGQYARFQNELTEVATKQLGLDGEKDLTPEDRKSIKGLVAKIAAKYLEKNNGTEGLKEMQTKLQDALAQVETLTKAGEEKLKTELEKVNGANTAKLIKTLAKVELSNLDGIELSVSPSLISETILAQISAKYAVVVDDNDNLTIMQKANPTLKVLDAAGKEVTFQQVLKKTVLENKAGVESKIDADPKKKKVVIGGGEGGDDQTFEMPSYIANKIKENE